MFVAVTGVVVSACAYCLLAITGNLEWFSAAVGEFISVSEDAAAITRETRVAVETLNNVAVATAEDGAQILRNTTDITRVLGNAANAAERNYSVLSRTYGTFSRSAARVARLPSRAVRSTVRGSQMLAHQAGRFGRAFRVQPGRVTSTLANAEEVYNDNVGLLDSTAVITP